ncbi:hypothetical protein SISSUDRAFT_1121657 [Sistotremastrum suecicum HHB10207 ss-3]|uniref:Uncharacterized protein n=1 Tax=Sistotremastrum suecicum HHB10207 ss-3 TaxID=1314776 RepID=A0A166AIA3_9AGAM|nr:hypothetical protein SISSUDRAFT_1121657 [Sistotremastrum suecicum HHB10207 ss-3]
MLSTVEEYVEALSTYYVYFIPTLIGYIIAAPAVLTYWIAVEATPINDAPVDSKTISDVKKAAFRRKLALFSTYGVVYLLFMAMFIQDTDGPMAVKVTILTITALLLSLGQTLSLIVFFGRECTSTQFVVRRKCDGSVDTDELKSSDLQTRMTLLGRMFLVVTFSLLLSWSSLFFGIRSLLALSAIGVVYAVNQEQRSKISMKTMLIVYPIIAIFIASGVGYFISHTCGLGLCGISDIPSFYTTNEVAVLMVSWMQWIFTVIAAANQGPLLLTLYRFDYHNAITSQSSIRPRLHLSPLIDSPTSRPLGVGVVIPPKSKLPAFSKPYFTSAILTWTLIHFGAIVWFPAVHPVFQFFFALFVGACAMLFVSLVTYGLATYRGERQALLAYKENWKLDVPGPVIEEMTK